MVLGRKLFGCMLLTLFKSWKRCVSFHLCKRLSAITNIFEPCSGAESAPWANLWDTRSCASHARSLQYVCLCCLWASWITTGNYDKKHISLPLNILPSFVVHTTALSLSFLFPDAWFMFTVTTFVLRMDKCMKCIWTMMEQQYIATVIVSSSCSCWPWVDSAYVIVL